MSVCLFVLEEIYSVELNQTTFGGRQSSVDDDHWCKTTFGERQPSVKDNLQWKATFGERRPLVEDQLWW